MAQHATALKVVDFAPAPAVPVDLPPIQPAIVEEAKAERPVWLFRGLFGVNLTLWVGIVATIRYMI